MSFHVEQVSKDEWLEKYHDKSFLRVFGESKAKESERSDFSLVVFKNEIPCGFVTCIEMDSKNLYWQLGGASTDFQKTWDVMSGYLAFLDWCSKRYESVSTRIQNTNLSMLKMALKCGFLIIGTRNFGNEVYLELIREFNHG